jgi:DNA adenine methylase
MLFVETKAVRIELHDTLLECKSDVLLSYNECPFIDELYSESKWYKMKLSRPHSMVLHRGSGAVYNEFLIANYDIYKLYNGDGQLTFLELFDDLTHLYRYTMTTIRTLQTL